MHWRFLMIQKYSLHCKKKEKKIHLNLKKGKTSLGILLNILYSSKVDMLKK